jgi:glycosidase
MTERNLTEINWADLTDRPFFPSPAAWEDQVLYFMMLDRFSDGREQGYRANDGTTVGDGTTPPFRPPDAGDAIGSEEDARHWREAGARWVGGTLKGLTSKLGYLHRLGVTAVWVSPVLKQVAFQETYHGYGIQNFLDVDPHFGTRDDLREMVRVAHDHGIYVILDIILNHVGNVFGYEPDRHWTRNEQTGEWFLDPRWDGHPYRVKGFHDEQGDPSLPFQRLDPPHRDAAWPNGAIWPAEFQEPPLYTQKGRISNWEHYPEYLDGDFFDLKDITLGHGGLDTYRPSPALLALCQVCKFWIAFADVDGFRVDTVKHMDPGATRLFAAVIHEFAQSLGKEKFYLIGEITGGRERAFTTLEETGLDAALGISDEPGKLEGLIKGEVNPEEYFDLFRNSLLVRKESHVWFRNKVVTILDDHDQVRKGENKARFCAGDAAWPKLVLNALALNATTLGIPCFYYGTEQRFDGAGGNDRYIREAMFGGTFGAFRSRERHFFDEEGPVYQELAKILALRKDKIGLRRGRQYLREISGDGESFGLPRLIGGRMRSVVPWSRLFDNRELLLAINTDPDGPTTAWVIVDNDLHPAGDRLRCLHSTEEGQVGGEIAVQGVKGGSAKAVSLTVPAAGFVIYE